jgi:hypothetical protein
MYPWIANPAMAQVVALDLLQADRRAARTQSRLARVERVPAEQARTEQAVAQDAPPVPTTAVNARRRRLARVLHLAH